LKCFHKDIPKIIKEEYNKEVFEFFIECPKDDEDVYDCIVRFFNINWSSYCDHLKKRKASERTRSVQSSKDLPQLL